MGIRLAPSPVSFIHETKLPASDAAAAAFLSFMPDYFKDKVYLLHGIRRKVATKFSIDAHQIYVCGSSQLGYSYIKQKEFTPKESDLDLAIISSTLFSKYFSIAIKETNGFSDLIKFENQTQSSSFFSYISRYGMIRPDLFPRSTEKTLFFGFFDKLSSEYRDHFKNINSAIYVSETAFAFKQVKCIEAARGA